MMEDHERKFLNEVMRNSLRYQLERNEAQAAAGILFLIGLAIGTAAGIVLTTIFS